MIFTQHFIERAKERNYTIKIIKQILSHPDKIEKQEWWIICHKKLIGKYVHVLIYKKLEKDEHLITYYKTSKVKKYL